MTPVQRDEAEALDLTPEQRELVRSLDISWDQAERGDTHCIWEFLEELRSEG